MPLQDAFWHVLNFFAAPLGLAALAAGLAKVAWRQELRRVSWWRLAAAAGAVDAAVAVTGLLLSGRDGRMATYAAMVLGCALALWWRGFLRPAR